MSARTFLRGLARSGAALAAAALLTTLAGCDTVGGALYIYTTDSPELARASVSAEGVWESSPWDGEGVAWLPYPERATLELEHTLGRAPRVVLVYLAFDEAGTDPALAAGDLARLVTIDATTIGVRNDTNAAFFCRVVAF